MIKIAPTLLSLLIVGLVSPGCQRTPTQSSTPQPAEVELQQDLTETPSPRTLEAPLPDTPTPPSPSDVKEPGPLPDLESDLAVRESSESNSPDIQESISEAQRLFNRSESREVQGDYKSAFLDLRRAWKFVDDVENENAKALAREISSSMAALTTKLSAENSPSISDDSRTLILD